MRGVSACIWLLALVAQLQGAGGAENNFSTAESPYAVDFGIPVFGRKCAEVPVIQNAVFCSYGHIATAPYAPPPMDGCRWSQAVLRLDGAIRGVQFDRFGAVWLSGVEILRFTTPEPTARGVSWQVLRDVTSVHPALAAHGNMSVQIPTIVDATYTGRFQINVSVDFYEAPDFSGAKPSKLVRPLRNWSRPSLFLAGVSGDQPQVNTLARLPRSMVSAWLELFASAHGCEEFWYSNLPDADTPHGGCGGGAYRELEVYVDGILAGVNYPFPVIYTGGVNPLLWRPLTGIASFDVPPYFFDLSPLLGLLNDGGEHNVSLAVAGNNRAGIWYLDGVFHAELASEQEVLTGELLSHSDHRHVNRSEQVSNESNETTTVITTTGRRDVQLVGTLVRSGVAVNLSLDQHLEAYNSNILLGEDVQVSSGWMDSKTTSERRSFGAESREESVAVWRNFPYSVWDEAEEDSETFKLGPTRVDYSRHLEVAVRRPGSPTFQLRQSNGISATALYNRSRTNHSLVYARQSRSEESALLQAGRLVSDSLPETCMEGNFVAEQGATTHWSEMPGSCDWSAAAGGRYVCGLGVCQQLDGVSRAAQGLLRAERRGGGGGSATAEPVASEGLAPRTALLARRGHRGGGSSQDGSGAAPRREADLLV